MRRLLDVTAAALGLLLLSPLLGAVALAVRLSSPGSILFRAKRVGKGGVPFLLLKFRTMRDGEGGPAITASGDRRVTPVGRLLRKAKLDELPQLLNVLRGEMSLMGPRPEDPRYVAMYTAAQRRILEVLPGITSAASLRFRHEEQLLTGPGWERKYIEEVMPEKLSIDLAWLERRTLLSDLRLLAQTLLAVLR